MILKKVKRIDISAIYSSHFLIFAVQAFVNLVLTLCDAGDSVVMFAPYYFNSYMAFQMTGITDILVGPGNPETLHPDVGKTPHDLATSYFFTCIGLGKKNLSLLRETSS